MSEGRLADDVSDMSVSVDRAGAVQVTQASKSYGDVRALDEVTFSIACGEVVALLGPNGAGKTTLISMIAGVIRPDSGSVTVRGLDMSRRSREARRSVGYAAQELAIYPSSTVRENLLLFAHLVDIPRPKVAAEIEEVSDAVGLTRLMHRKAGLLSGGEKRRLHTAIALLGHPPVLLLDEPTVGADIQTRARLLDLVKQLARNGAAICYSTHYLAEVEELGPTVAVLNHGHLVTRVGYQQLTATSRRRLVEVEFSGSVPDGDFGAEAVRSGSKVLVLTDDPRATVEAIHAAVDGRRDSIASLQYGPPSLEGWYTSLLWDDGGHNAPS